MSWHAALRPMKIATEKMAEKAGSLKKRLGNKGEDLAAAFLIKNGYAILARNYRALQAEIDIVCEDALAADESEGDLVFVEVKTRATLTHGSPLESVTPEKLRHVKRAATYFLYEKGIEDRNCRFDIIGVQMVSGSPKIEHLQDVVDY